MADFAGSTRPAESMVTESTAIEQPKRRRTREADVADLDGITDQLNAVSLAISAAMDKEEPENDEDEAEFGGGMEELRRWYQTEVFSASEQQQQRWEERRWAFLGQLQHVLRKPLTHTVFSYRIEAVCDEDDDVAAYRATLAETARRHAEAPPPTANAGTGTNASTTTVAPGGGAAAAAAAASQTSGGPAAGPTPTTPPDGVTSVFGGLLFVGRSRYNDVVVADETVSRVHCIIVRSAGKVGVFDGWSSYGTVTLARGDQSKKCKDSSHDNRRPLLFDQGEPFLLRVGKNATILFPGH